MGKSSSGLTAGSARVECLNVLRVPDSHLGVELRAYVRLSFRPVGEKDDLTIYFYPTDPDTVKFLVNMMHERLPLYMEIEGLKSPVPFFDTLARKLGFRTYWIGPWDIVQMNQGDKPLRIPL